MPKPYKQKYGLKKYRMKIDRHPNPEIDRMVDETAHQIIQGMTPLELGLLRYPYATPREVGEVPGNIIADHLKRYTMQDLIEGQFLEVLPGKYTFFMGHETKKRKDRESEQEDK